MKIFFEYINYRDISIIMPRNEVKRVNKKDFLEILPILSVSDDITSLRKISNPIELEKRMMQIMKLIRGS